MDRAIINQLKMILMAGGFGLKPFLLCPELKDPCLDF